MATKAPVTVQSASTARDYFLIYSQDFRYLTWEGTRGYPVVAGNTNSGSGHQFYSPMSLQLLARPAWSDFSVDLLLRGGYVDSEQKTTGQSGHYAGWIDTLASGTVRYHGNPYFTPFVTLAANLPTGETTLRGNSAFARMDPDSVYVATFGEGFNVGVTAGVVVPIGIKRNVSFAVGHTNRGSYTRDDPTAPPNGLMRVSPSDETTVAARYNHNLGVFEYWADVTYGWQSTTTVTLPAAFLMVDPGDRISLGAGARYSWTPRWHTRAQFNYTHIAENDARNQLGPLGTPGVNANNDTYFVSLEHRYGIGDFGAGLRGSYFKREGNEYSVATLNFIPAKDKWSVTAFATLPAAERLSLDAQVSRIWIDEDAAPGSGLPSVDRDVWAFSLGVRYVW